MSCWHKKIHLPSLHWGVHPPWALFSTIISQSQDFWSEKKVRSSCKSSSCSHCAMNIKARLAHVLLLVNVLWCRTFYCTPNHFTAQGNKSLSYHTVSNFTAKQAWVLHTKLFCGTHKYTPFRRTQEDFWCSAPYSPKNKDGTWTITDLGLTNSWTRTRFCGEQREKFIHLACKRPVLDRERLESFQELPPKKHVPVLSGLIRFIRIDPIIRATE